MNKIRPIFLFLSLLSCISYSHTQTIADFTLPDTKGNQISLSQYKSRSAIVAVFMSNNCVYAKKYEKRLLGLREKYALKNIQFLFINPNNPNLSDEDCIEVMREKAKFYPFPYLQDSTGKVAKLFSVHKNPHAIVLQPTDTAFTIYYQGKIDDNPLMEKSVKRAYLEEALQKILQSDVTPPESTTPVGCNIKR